MNLPRLPEAHVDPQFPERWSPRAFSPRPVAEADLLSLFEAARWAPSAANSQPWFFLAAVTPQEHARFLDLLHPGNQIWAARAPVLLFLLARRISSSGRTLEWGPFDAGAAWLALALQARKLGLFAHAMGGFDRERVYSALHIPAAEYTAQVAIAVGYYGDPLELSEELQQREHPSMRKSLQDLYHLGAFAAV
ncbi:MAG TPA: nitroreductase family protein [bacterium]|nr:nitroreductase family protein [bacterium]HQG46413.1 nitroreductase family protein [bacterium]HQI47603.1 nitroreductase family protein [bacterium]HQJ64380.1 nitroreductase family protein [bacterium]HQJ65492.1 nitroreductase family protein [bacterium]